MMTARVETPLSPLPSPRLPTHGVGPRARACVGLLVLAFAAGAALPVPVAASETEAAVTVGDYFFEPQVVTLHFDLEGGNRVTFTSWPGSEARHQAHGDPHKSHIEAAVCFSGPVLEGGESATVTLNPACAALGRIDYHCHIHPGLMRGTILFA